MSSDVDADNVVADNAVISGSCLCGKVAFTAQGVHDSMSHCHCSMCRKIHGTAFATYLSVDSFSIERGASHIRQYESSPGFFRCFCDSCGSVLPDRVPEQRDDGKPGLSDWYIPAGLLDEDPGVRPNRHIFAESKANWYPITDALPQYNGYTQLLASPRSPAPGDTTRTAAATDDSQLFHGSCLCGDVHYEFDGAPEQLMYCHCSRCRKVKGAAHATNAFVKPERFRWLEGETGVVIYDLPGAQRFGNSFCQRCGSSVPRKSANSPLWNIPAGSIDDAIEMAPKAHIYTASKAPWFAICDDTEQFSEIPG